MDRVGAQGCDDAVEKEAEKEMEDEKPTVVTQPQEDTPTTACGSRGFTTSLSPASIAYLVNRRRELAERIGLLTAQVFESLREEWVGLVAMLTPLTPEEQHARQVVADVSGGEGMTLRC